MKKKKIRVLLIEDNQGDERLIREMMGEAKDTIPEIECVDRLDGGLKRLARRGIDILLLDLGLPDSQGLDTFVRVHKKTKDLPIVVLTGLVDEELGLKAVRKGAQDYLIKGQVDSNLLIRAMHYAIERKRAEVQIKSSLREKELLLRELHHRVKNNIQIISSLLRLQSENIKEKRALDIFNNMQNRLRAMAFIHERLYKSKNYTRVRFIEYVQSLTGHLFRLYGISPYIIKLNMNIKNVSLDISTAIPCGLIINELVTNALKHAFPDGKKGEIKIIMQPLNRNEIELVVSDNGVGLPETMDLRKTESLGLHLVYILAEDQLQGEINVDRTKGTRFQIRFKVKQ